MKYCFFTALAAVCLMFTACGGANAPTEEDEIIKNPQEEIDPKTLENDYVYTLPVIFHVLYIDPNDATQYVSATRLKDILNNVNDLYAGNVYGPSEAVNVKFTLATHDVASVSHRSWNNTQHALARRRMGVGSRRQGWNMCSGKRNILSM